MVVDGGMICGWRRSTPSLEQLHQAVFHLRTVWADAAVVVVADPALKHALATSEQPLLDADIEIGALVMAPAGTIGGFHGFLGQVVAQADHRGFAPVVITDRAIPDATLGRMRVDGGRYLFDLDTGTVMASTVAPSPSSGRRRRRRAPASV